MNDFKIQNGVLIKYTGPGGDVIIPEDVTVIGSYAFEECDSLHSVTFPNGLTEIRYSAFNGCTCLTSIIIPDGVTEICASAFQDCANLVSVSLPDSIEEIGDFAFSYCQRLSSIHLPDGITSIGYSAFQDCVNLVSITLPDSIEEIGDFAFSHCRSLSSIHLPDGLTEIGKGAFDHCTGLTAVVIPAGIRCMGGSVFHGCHLEFLSFPESVTSLSGDRYTGCILTGVMVDALCLPGVPFEKMSYWTGSEKISLVGEAMVGHAQMVANGYPFSKEKAAEYEKEIHRHRKQHYPRAIRHPELLYYMISKKIIHADEVDGLLDLADRENRIDLKAAILEYAKTNQPPVEDLFSV